MTCHTNLSYYLSPSPPSRMQPFYLPIYPPVAENKTKWLKNTAEEFKKRAAASVNFIKDGIWHSWIRGRALLDDCYLRTLRQVEPLLWGGPLAFVLPEGRQKKRPWPSGGTVSGDGSSLNEVGVCEKAGDTDPLAGCHGSHRYVTRRTVTPVEGPRAGGYVQTWHPH